jgi:hypothetical protein
LKKYESQDRGADKPITVQEQHTAWKSRTVEYGAAFQLRQAFFATSLAPRPLPAIFATNTTEA